MRMNLPIASEHELSAEDTLRAVMEGTAAVTGQNFFRSLVRHLAQALQVRHTFIAECTDHNNDQVRTLAFWTDDRFADDIVFPLQGTPCDRVIAGEICCYPKGLQSLFPEDKALRDLRAESYLGVPLQSSAGNVLGHLVVMDDKPVDDMHRHVSILKIFAARAGAELERKHAEDALKKSEKRLRTLLDINNAIVTKLTRDELFNGISEALARVITFDRLSLSLYDPQAHVLRLVTYAGPYRRDDYSPVGRVLELDAEFLMEIASQVAIAVDNMKAHEETAALKARFQSETVYLQEEIKTEHNFEEIIGQSLPVQKLLRQVEQVAPTEATVLIRGETGTGKELLARAVHDRSRRKDRPLVKVNCGSIPSGLVESELFGHEKGAFTE